MCRRDAGQRHRLVPRVSYARLQECERVARGQRSEVEEATAPLQATARLEARDAGREEARQQRREGVWVLY